jgi:myo-inositol 2-dehydrogenase/D-chiro-inositol 1-dehydrogenase
VTVGIGVVGCGRAATTLHLPALARVPDAKVVALSDVDPQRLSAIGAVGARAARYLDYRALLDDRSVEVVLISVPTPWHHDVFVAAAKAGKHIYLEKPFALDLDEADHMLAVAATAGTRAGLGFNLRSHRLVQAARDWIRAGALGRVVALRTIVVGGLQDRVGWQRRRAEGGGAIYELGSHHFDLWRFLLDTDAEEVRGHSRWTEWDDSTVAVSAHLASGAFAATLLVLRGFASHDVEVIGESASLRFSLYRGDSLEIRPAGRLSQFTHWLRQLPAATTSARRGGDYLDSFRRHWTRFLDSLPGGAPPATLQDGREALRIAVAAMHSSTAS